MGFATEREVTCPHCGQGTMQYVDTVSKKSGVLECKRCGRKVEYEVPSYGKLNVKKASLRDLLIKLGSQRPELRKHIRPILKQAGSEDVFTKPLEQACMDYGNKMCRKAYGKITRSLSDTRYQDDGWHVNDQNQWVLRLSGPSRDDFYDVFFTLKVEAVVELFNSEAEVEWDLIVTYKGRNDVVNGGDKDIEALTRKAVKAIEDHMDNQG